MANFLFNATKLAMCNGGGFDWMDDEIVGVLYDNRITPAPDMVWSALSSFVVATSGVMTGRGVQPDGRMTGSSLRFASVTTEPGLRIRGLLLKYQTGNVLIAHFDTGLDGFSGNSDLEIEASGLEIYARTTAANLGTWIAL